MTEAIYRRCINPVDAHLQRVPHGLERCGIVLRAPAKCPATSADGPCAKTDDGDLQTAGAQAPSRQLRSLRSFHPQLLFSLVDGSECDVFPKFSSVVGKTDGPAARYSTEMPVEIERFAERRDLIPSPAQRS